jgi:hypothetical protein
LFRLAAIRFSLQSLSAPLHFRGSLLRLTTGCAGRRKLRIGGSFIGAIAGFVVLAVVRGGAGKPQLVPSLVELGGSVSLCTRLLGLLDQRLGSRDFSHRATGRGAARTEQPDGCRNEESFTQ